MLSFIKIKIKKKNYFDTSLIFSLVNLALTQLVKVYKYFSIGKNTEVKKKKKKWCFCIFTGHLYIKNRKLI